MKREPFGFYLFRILATVAIIALLIMVYWSSSLIEENLQTLIKGYQELKSENEGLRSDVQRLKGELLVEMTAPGEESPFHSEESSFFEQGGKSSPYSNLLEEDKFYSLTLPRLLPSSFHPSGIRKEGRLGKPQHLHPFNSFADVSSMWSLCNVSVAQLQFGKYESLAPNMAIRMEARPLGDDPNVFEYWIHLREGVYWKPLRQDHFPSGVTLAPHFLKKHKVTAHDFKFFYDVLMNPYVSEPKAAALRTYFGDIEEFRIIDDLTFVVRWKSEPVYVEALGEYVPKVKYTARSLTGGLQPLPRFVYQYFPDGSKIVSEDSDPETYRNNSIFAQNFAEHFAKNIIPSCGPWEFYGMNDEGIRFKRNLDYYEPLAVLVEGLDYTFKESFDAIWQNFKAGKSDMCVLAPSQLPELKAFLASRAYQDQKAKGCAINELDFVDESFNYLAYNQSNPLFKSKKVRQALTMAIDRDRIIEQNLNTMGIAITGPFYRFSPAYDATIQAWPYNPDEARRYLDEEGWIDFDGDGYREKMIDGRKIPFRFSLSYYVKNTSTKVISEYIATAFKEVGVDCRLNGVDITDLSKEFDDKTFDALYLGWRLGTPPEDPKQLWHSSGAKEKGSSNGIGFSNPEVDKIIEALHYEYDKEKRIELYHKFHKIIHEEAPYTFLFSPIVRLLYREYVQNLFIPRERQDLIPGADVSSPDFRVIWLSPPDKRC